MLRKYLRKITDRILAPYLDAQGKMYMQQIPALNQATQLLLKLAYQELARSRKPLPGFGDVEFRSFSQNGEDGILLYIFSLIGTTNKKAVEIGCGNGLENNTANLIINHGWRGLLIDGDAKNIAHAKEFYTHSRDTFITPPNTLQLTRHCSAYLLVILLGNTNRCFCLFPCLSWTRGNRPPLLRERPSRAL